jgi:tetratricopeptide (TPR) repeat protein
MRVVRILIAENQGTNLMHPPWIFTGLLILSCTVAGNGQKAGKAEWLELAREQYIRGRFTQAKHLYTAALEAAEADDEKGRAEILVELADVYINEERFPEAEAAYAKALAYYRQKSDNYKTAIILRDLASIYSLEGHHADALRYLNQAREVAGSNSPSNAKVMAQILNSQGIVYHRQKKTGKALSHFQKALSTVQSTSGADVQRAEILGNLASIYYTKRQFDRALGALQESLAISEKLVGPDHPDLTFSLSTLGLVYAAMGRYDEAQQAYQRCLAIFEADKAVFELRIARVLYGLSNVHFRSGNTKEAEAVLDQAATIARRNLPAHPEMSVVLEEYSRLLAHLGKAESARHVHLEAERARVAAELVIRAHRPN